MKKLATLAALAALALPVIATEVTSSNVVGYQKITIHPTWTMIPNQFVNIGTAQAPILNDMFDSAATTIAGGENESTSDNIQVWTGSTYQTYFFGNYNGEYGEEYDNVWYDVNDSDEPTTDTLPVGNGAWFKNLSGETKTLTVSGQVATGTVTVTIGDLWTMLANPFPVAIPLNGDIIDWAASGTLGGENESTSDNIQLWTGTTYKTYFFGNYNGEFGEEYDNVWYDVNDSDEPTADVIPAGTAVWYKNNGGTPFTISFSSPVN